MLSRVTPLVALACLASIPALAAPILESFSPRSGPPGTVVTVTGTGFGADSSALTVTVGESPVVVSSLSDTQFTFTTTSSTASGLLRLTTQDATTTSAIPFLVLRTIEGDLQLPAGMSTTGYRVGRGLNAAPAAADGSFTSAALADVPEIISAWRTGDDPVFMAVARPDSASVTLNARSTAIALVFCSPLISLHDGPATNDLLSRVNTWTETAEVAAVISAVAADGRSYVDDARFVQAYEALLLKALQPAPAASSLAHPELPAPAPGVRAFSILKNEITPARVKPAVRALANAPGSWAIEMESDPDHPNLLQQGLLFTRVDPASFPSGIHSIQNMDSSSGVTLMGAAPLGRGFLGASLRSDALDLSNQFGKAMANFLDRSVGTKRHVSTSGFLAPKNEPAVYEVRAFSGNLAYGTTLFLGPNADQTIALSNLDRDHEWRRALVSNLVIAAIDIASIWLGETKGIKESDLAGLLLNMEVEVTKAIDAHLASGRDLDAATFWDIVKGAAVGFAKSAGPLVIEPTFDELFITEFGKSIGRLLKRVVDVTSKVSVGLQAVERAGNLVLPTHFAVERTMIVVGDPFAPSIDTFTPRSGRAGTTVYLSGRGLPANIGDLRISLCSFAATGNPPTINASLPVTILAGNSSGVAVKLPDSATIAATFGEGNHALYWRTENLVAGSSHTTRFNSAPFDRFFFHGPPQITGVSPEQLVPGTMFSVEATGLQGAADLDLVAKVQGYALWPQAAAGGVLVFELPAGLSNGTSPLTLETRDPNSLQVVETSAPFNVTIANPWAGPIGEQAGGLTIRISKWDMSNAADGHISLYEAFAIAGGTLGRAIEDHPTPDDTILRERDWIWGDGTGGAGVRDSIIIENSVNVSDPLILSTPLPRLGNGDSVLLRGVLDGSNLPEGAVGLDLTGLEGVEVSGGTWQNFPGVGIHLGAGSRLNHISSASILHAGDVGLLIEDGAEFNTFFAITVEDAGSHGIHLTGTGTRGNLIASSSTPPLFGGELAGTRVRRAGGVGVRIDSGAADNQVDVLEVRDGASHGIEIVGPGTVRNSVGWVAGIQGTRYVTGNEGDGVRIGDGAAGTLTWSLVAAGNAADGYHVFGAETTDVVLRGPWTGVNVPPGAETFVAEPNAGYSIALRGVRRCTIGSPGRVGMGDDTCIGGSALGGILLDDADDCVLRGLLIGRFNTLFGAIDGDSWLPVGSGHAIHLRNGSSGNELGDEIADGALDVRAAPTGSGILIEGEGTDNNVVLGSRFGALTASPGTNPDEELAYGVSIIDGASGNVIGAAGIRRSVSGATLQPYNSFHYASAAAVRIENVAADFDAGGEPINPNRIVANTFGVTGFGAPSLQPYVGVLLKGATRGQWIGGPFPQAGNQFSRIGFAGIHLDNVTASSYAERNRFGGNWISSAINPGLTNTDPLAGPVRTHSLLISGGTNQVVGEGWIANNQFFAGEVGVFIDGGSGHRVQSARVDNHPIAGVVLRNTTDTLIGGHELDHRLQLTRNGGGGGVHTAAILITGGEFNQVAGCWIGDEGSGTDFWANPGDGVRIVDSAHNTIGGAHPQEGNVITRSGGDGIHVRGSESHDNFIGRNVIGRNTLGAVAGNVGAGIEFAAGASSNQVGGFHLQTLAANPVSIPAPNIITGNEGDGVLVNGSGGSTHGNRILLNSIFANDGLGVALVGGGNHTQPPPTNILLDDTHVSGGVSSLASTPAGSRVEIFVDDDVVQPEGETFIGSTTVRADGTWRMPRPLVPAGKVLTVTVTNADTGDTSEFATGTILEDTMGFRIDKTPGTAPAADLWPGGSALPLLGLTLTSDGVDVVLNELQLTLGGTAAPADLSLMVVHDTNNDGAFDPGDRALSDEISPADTAPVIPLVQASLGADEIQRWLVVGRASSTASTGGTLQVELTSAAHMDTRLVLPVGMPTTPAGSFPIQSNTFTIGSGSVPPVLITAQPPDVTVTAGGGLQLGVTAQGTGLTYQWLRNGLPIPGATSASYIVPAAQAFHAGTYSVIVSSTAGSQVSHAATVTIEAAPASDARLLNLSTRGYSQSGDNRLIPGFVIQGTTNKRLLMRSVGPTLQLPPIGFSGAVTPDPEIELKRYNFATQAYETYATNDDWMDNSNAVDIADAAADLFAFELKDERDAALLLDIPPGQYSIFAGDKNGTSGVAIVEIYDADAAGAASRLINISNRGFCGVGEQVMIPGFVISSEGPRTLLIRVVGPTLGQAPYHVPGTMADPKLTLYRTNGAGQSEYVLEQDNWGDSLDAGNTAATAAQLFAFPLAEGSADAAFVVTLEPGVYSVVGSSAAPNGTGVILVEIYMVP